MDLVKVFMSFLVSMCALGLCGVCGEKFHVHAVGCKARLSREQTREFKVQSL